MFSGQDLSCASAATDAERWRRQAGARAVEETDISRAADQMVKLHGDGAKLAAAKRADKMRDQGDEDGFHTWTRIVDIIRDLERKKPGTG